MGLSLAFGLSQDFDDGQAKARGEGSLAWFLLIQAPLDFPHLSKLGAKHSKQELEILAWPGKACF